LLLIESVTGLTLGTRTEANPASDGKEEDGYRRS
jgi:hypothetical protein